MRLFGPLSPLGLITAGLACLADQIHKWYMIDYVGLIEGQSRIVVTPFFEIVFTRNKGISYGLLPQASALGQWILTGFAGLAVLALVIWLSHARHRLQAISLGLIIGGALGNAIDRARDGAVSDFFHFHVGSFSWYIFNVADIAIVCGVAGLLYESIRSSHKSAGNEV